MLHTKNITIKQVVDDMTPDFLDADFCRQWLLNRVHPEGPVCPWCGAEIQGRAAGRFWELKKIECPACGRKFTARTNTELSGLKLDERGLVLFCLLVGAGFPLSWIAKRFNISIRALYMYRDRFQK